MSSAIGQAKPDLFTLFKRTHRCADVHAGAVTLLFTERGSEVGILQGLMSCGNSQLRSAVHSCALFWGETESRGIKVPNLSRNLCGQWAGVEAGDASYTRA